MESNVGVCHRLKLKVLTCYTMPRPEGFDLCNPAGGNIHTPSSLIALSNGWPYLWLCHRTLRAVKSHGDIMLGDLATLFVTLRCLSAIVDTMAYEQLP